ncbi:MAG: T9SS type A sorting domain-containing protein [Chitinispirillaceae bacterium]|nr:T9SS type A sorting domain-containing protein [Chitinispirillaceae bacterium]
MIRIQAGLIVCFCIIVMVFGQTQWTARESGTTLSLRSIVWTGERLVAVGDSGIILTSENGETWEACSSGTNKDLASIAWTGEKLMAVGDLGAIISSTNAINWANQSIQNSINITYVAFIEGVAYLLITAEKVADTIMLSSGNGVDWDKTPLTASNGNCLGLCWTGNKFYTAVWGGAILSSIDGRIWTREIFLSSSLFNHINWTGRKVIAVGSVGVSGSGRIITSTGNGSWQTNIPVVGTSLALNFIFATDQKSITIGDQGTILTSPDAETWTQQTSGTTRNLRCVTFTGTQYVAVGDSGTIITSPAETGTVSRSALYHLNHHDISFKYANNMIHVCLPHALQGSRVSVYSVSGKRISSLSRQNVPVLFSITTSDLSPGLYHLVVEKEGVKTAKVFAVGSVQQ